MLVRLAGKDVCQVLGCTIHEQPFASRRFVKSDSTDAAIRTT
jgi:hypothetical protein